jgi:hypothetical protein
MMQVIMLVQMMMQVMGDGGVCDSGYQITNWRFIHHQGSY